MTQDSFEQMVQASVGQTMSKTLGPDVWKAIAFFFDLKTAANNPEAFGKVLDRLFGATSKVLKQVIGQTLLTRVNAQTDSRKDREFPELIQIARAKFFSSSGLAV